MSQTDETDPTQEQIPEQTQGASAPRRRRRAASRPAGPPPVPTAEELAAAAERESHPAPEAPAEIPAPVDAPDLDETQAVEDDETDEQAAGDTAPAASIDASAAQDAASLPGETVGQSPVVTDELAGTDRPTPTTETLLPAPAEAPAAAGEAAADDAADDAPDDAADDAEPAQQSRPARRRRRATSREALAEVAEIAGETSPGPGVPQASESTDAEAPIGGGAAETETETDSAADEQPAPARSRRRRGAPPVVTFQPPEIVPFTRPAQADAEADDLELADPHADLELDDVTDELGEEPAEDGTEAGGAATRRRRRGRRGRGRPRDSEGGDAAETGDNASDAAARAGDELAEGADAPGSADADDSTEPDAGEAADGEAAEDDSDTPAGTTRRRRRRRRGGAGAADAELAPDDPPNTVVHVREPRSAESAVRGVTGSTRLEAKRQRRRDGRDQGRKRVPIATEAEFLARREAVERVMVVRNVGDRTQIAVLEDDVLVEHYVTRASSSAYAGNVYLGRVQNVLPGMEAAFVDIGKGRNGVLYAGEVNYDASGLEGKPRKIEQALKSGQSIVVQVTKDPIGHKGARLTSQVSLPGRYMVYVPEGGSAGISRKLPDTERTRLRGILKQITPEDAGVIVRTAAEGATEDELGRDIERLAAQWDALGKKAAKASAPALLYAEPDLVIRVVRDVFNEDFAQLIVQGEEEWTQIEQYLSSVAPDLMPRLRKHAAVEDVFTTLRIDEQLLKALDRKVYLPSGGSLVFDRTEAMTVVDVNTGRYTGKGSGNLEETVTRNNLEAAEELVRQLRLRDVGGMIVVDFIDMVLESNRELVLRRLTECLGRDRTKHQVAEVTSLGLVQMTRKRVGQGLYEAYAEPCPTCGGRGALVELPAPKPRPIPRPPAAPPRRESTAEGETAGANGDAPSAEPGPGDAASAAGDFVADLDPVEISGSTEPAEPAEPVAPDLLPSDAFDPAAAESVMEGGAELPEHGERVEIEVGGVAIEPIPAEPIPGEPIPGEPLAAEPAPAVSEAAEPEPEPQPVAGG